VTHPPRCASRGCYFPPQIFGTPHWGPLQRARGQPAAPEDVTIFSRLFGGKKWPPHKTWAIFPGGQTPFGKSPPLFNLGVGKPFPKPLPPISNPQSPFFPPIKGSPQRSSPNLNPFWTLIQIGILHAPWNTYT